MFELKQIAPATYELPKSGKMLVPGLVIATPDLLKEIERPLDQVRNVACLPGIIGYSIAMPDIHWGYGFPIGGVAAMDALTGVISPGGVGYDINCGVRLALLEEPFAGFNEHTKQELLKEIFNQVPSGVGRGQRSEKRQINDADYKKIIEMGARWSIEQGYGFPDDLEHMESHGCIEGADFAAISFTARERGSRQLGSIGSGNHFVEIGAVDRIFLPETAKEWGVRAGMTYVLIHSGSRGFGHQICQDTLDEFMKKGYAEGLPDRQLACAPIKSPEGEKYFQAMAGAANYAFNNRQQILSGVRAAFQTVCRIPPKNVRLLYDVCHNIAKFEVHGGKRLCVHRKGATRAFGKGAEELSTLFKNTGQPVLVPGDMGRASYLLAGLGNPRTWCSSCHGAGRARSRIQSMAAWKGVDLKAKMLREGVHVLASSMRTVAEEMPDAYKDVDAVVEAVEEARLADRVARLKPSLVIKG